MSLVVDFLSAEVPDVGAEGGAVRLIEFPLNYVDAFGGSLIGFDFEFGILEFFNKGCFSGFPFTDDEEFCFVEGRSIVRVLGFEVEVEDSFTIAWTTEPFLTS